MADRPLVSIIVPSYNQGRYIRETIDSCLAQDYRPIEILVIDGASNDQTVDVLRAFQAPELRWWSEPDDGVVDAVNKGLSRATGGLLSIQSSDDLFLAGAFTAAVETFERWPELGLVCVDVEYVDDDSSVVGVDRQGEFSLAECVGRLQYIPQPGAFFTREALEAVGGWRAPYSYAADADFWIRIALRFPVRRIERVLARYRYHDQQRDRQKARILADWTASISSLIDSGDLKGDLVRWARMGVHLARYRYTPEDHHLARTRALYSALLENPGAVRDRRFPKRELLPFREPLWRLLSRLKRAVGLKPRGA